ncbi:hypothetical protein [Paracerasibacillus soli]|uniref:Uncharacterized protein n=1 Tax=Paracerasibacillus soli TaxID=480284 RepID=A0ABU5CVP1_9BACI|nr:hypothetical protein [Virgibacillus soli]MDY0410451.1 hypothetical protein [Virgibacillus soli]
MSKEYISTINMIVFEGLKWLQKRRIAKNKQGCFCLFAIKDNKDK